MLRLICMFLIFCLRGNFCCNMAFNVERWHKKKVWGVGVGVLVSHHYPYAPTALNTLRTNGPTPTIINLSKVHVIQLHRVQFCMLLTRHRIYYTLTQTLTLEENGRAFEFSTCCSYNRRRDNGA